MNAGFKTLFFLLIVTASAQAETHCISDTKEAFKKANFLKTENQNLLASQQYALIESFACSEEQRITASIEYAKALYRLGEKSTAEASLDNLSQYKLSDFQKRQIALLKAWNNPIYQKDLNAVDTKSFQDFYQKESELKENSKLKKPWLAGSLSAILPGAGQVYNNNYQSAAMSFVLNAVFLATALELEKNGMHTSALAAALVFSVTYTGNILGSVQSAKKINDHYLQPQIESLRKTIIPHLEP